MVQKKEFHLVPSMRISSKSVSESNFKSVQYDELSHIVSSLSVYMLNRHRANLISSSVKEKKSNREVELSMNLSSTSSHDAVKTSTVSSGSSSTSSKSHLDALIPVSISPSLSFESNKIVLDASSNRAYSSEKDESLSDETSDVESTFTLSIPDLSLENIVSSYTCVKHSPFHFSQPVRQLVALKGRTLISTAVAEGFISSFETAIQSRIQCWIKQISKVLATSYETKVDTAKQAFVKGSINHTVLQSDLQEIKGLIKSSSEARVVNALAQSASTICIHDVQTTICILEECMDQFKADAFLEEPPSKQMRISSQIDQKNLQENWDSHLSHALSITIKFTVMVSALKYYTFSMKSPGVINGSFKLNDGKPQVTDALLSFDIDKLAMAMENESRKIVRLCAQEVMIGQKINYCTIHDTVQSQLFQTEAFAVSSDDSDDECGLKCESGEKVLINESDSPTIGPHQDEHVTPRVESIKHNVGTPSNAILVTPTIFGRSSDSSSLSNIMPPPPPRLAFDETSQKRSSIFLHPRRISPTVDSNQNIESFLASSFSPKRKEIYSTSRTPESFPTPYHKNPWPSLVSPYKEIINHGNPRVHNSHMDRPTLPELG